MDRGKVEVVMETGLTHLLRRRLKAQADLFAALTSHPTLIGTGREDALAELLRQFMPRRFEILQGTVAVVDGDAQPMRSTHQLDLIAADTNDFPMLLRSGNVAVVAAQSVRAVMEVKSNLRRGASFVSALVQIAQARRLVVSDGPVFTGLFSFGAPTGAGTLRDWLADVVALRHLLVTKQGDPNIVEIRDALLATADGDVQVADEEELLEVLSNHNLPNVIAADQGAVARKNLGKGAPDFYTFFRGGDEVPSVMILIDRLIDYLGTTATSGIGRAFDIVRAHLAVDVSSELYALPLLEPTRQDAVAR